MIRIRPDFHLSSLSVEFRWESPRRHPVYIQLWKVLQSFRSSNEAESADELFLSEPIVMQAMQEIGINGLPIDPATDFKDLIDQETKPHWLHGGIQPITIRSLAGLLMASLSSETLTELSNMFRIAAAGPAETDARKSGIIHLKQSTAEELETVLNAPFYSISPVAPREQAVSDLSKIQAEWRDRHNLPTTRFREADLPNYLRAWDLHEGWRDGEYHRDSMIRMKDVATELGKNKTTARNWYQNAFPLITGHAYSQANWIKLMGVIHFAKQIQESINPFSVNRLKRASCERTVDDSTVSSGRNREGASVLDALSPREHEFDVERCLSQISELILEGRCDQKILEQMELSDIAIEVIAHLRDVLQSAPSDRASK